MSPFLQYFCQILYPGQKDQSLGYIYRYHIMLFANQILLHDAFLLHTLN